MSIMCIQTNTPCRRTKSRGSSPSSPHKPSKILKISEQQQTENDTKNARRKRPKKTVRFNEIVMVRPHPFQEKSVAFDEVVMVRPVLHVSEYTEEERNNTWCAIEDKQRIKLEILTTLKAAKENSFEGCTRGLEKLQDGGKTRERRRASIRDILDEQDAQREQARENGNEFVIYDVSKFRKIYKSHSRAARHVAHAVGKIDEMAAKPSQIQAQHHSVSRKSKSSRSPVPMRTTGWTYSCQDSKL